MNQDPFKEYIRQAEPDKKNKGYVWSTAIGLQDVDGLEPSDVLLSTAIDNIEGYVSMEEAEKRIDSYYAKNPEKPENCRTEEADKVSVRIASILFEKSFSFAPSEYIGIHKKLFRGIYNHAGKIRDYNITKKEWVLNGNTVLYGNASELRETLEYDFNMEKKFSYRGLSMDDIIHHLAYWVSRLWQIHVFCEGNTRTTAVFFIKYLRMLGFDATNNIFAENAWYFRNALVRANYTNLNENIHETTEYLEIFIKNLLLNQKNELKNRYLHIYKWFKKENKAIDGKNPAIDGENPAIDGENPAIEELIDRLSFNIQTKNSILKLFAEVGTSKNFGRKLASEICGISYSSAGSLIEKMKKSDLIEEIKGHGKGKYEFIIGFGSIN